MIFNFASLEIRPSSFMALFAGEGVGKSTLFDIFATTKSPEGGKISLLDGDREVPLREINEKKWLEQYVGYAPQKPETIDGFTLEENLLTKCGMKEADRALFERLLFVFGVPDWKDILGQKLGAKGGGRVLSPGEVQRLSLIRTLMTRPKVLLLDEPFSALSQETAVNLLIAVKNLKNSGVFDYQPTTILITHDSRQAELSDEIAFIDKDTATITQGTHEYLVATQLAYQANATAFSKDNIARLEGRRLPDVATVLPQSETVP
jgi:ABC-type multidrug transport system ATPase subunit